MPYSARGEYDPTKKQCSVASPIRRTSVRRAPQDLGFMYGHGFEDPDGHIWELSYMDMSAMPGD